MSRRALVRPQAAVVLLDPEIDQVDGQQGRPLLLERRDRLVQTRHQLRHRRRDLSHGGVIQPDLEDEADALESSPQVPLQSFVVRVVHSASPIAGRLLSRTLVASRAT